MKTCENCINREGNKCNVYHQFQNNCIGWSDKETKAKMLNDIVMYSKGRLGGKHYYDVAMKELLMLEEE